MNTRMPLKPVYALIGEDSFLQLQKLAEIRAQLPKDVQSMEFDGERAELAEVLDELRSFAMFGGGGKLVIVRNADEFVSRFRPQLEDYLAKPSSSGVLVLRVSTLPKTTRIYKLIDKLGGVEVCEPPKQAALPQWIIQRGKSVHKLAIDPAAANLLADLIGNDLGRLDNELAKIALQVEGGRVSTEQVLHSVSFQREQEIYDMTNELAMGRPDEALRRWRHLVQLDSSAEFRAVTWLTMWLEDVGIVVSGGSTAKMAWKYRERLPQFIKVANSLGQSRYARAVTLLAEMDRRAKSGLGDATDNVEQFILSFATGSR
jgi:DNA polymerase III delta subunit